MELYENETEQAFRREVRRFVETKLPDDLRDRVANFVRYEKSDFQRWHRIIGEHGWAGPNWPKEYGGTGWNAIQRKIFDEECFLGYAPRLIPHVNMITPVLHRYGTPAQKERFLPRIWPLEDWWTQGYSEPGAGSDLAGLKTRSERKGDRYVVNGQKIWTTWAHWADWMFCLVRTRADGKPQAGISFLLIDMKTPGITVRPIISLDGVHDVNEVFLDNVEVPVENLVGEENAGWTVAKYLLGHERTDLAGVGLTKRLMRFARRLTADACTQDPGLQQRLATLEIDLLAHEWTALRVLSSDESGKDPGPAASILKISSTELQQSITELMMDGVGPQAVPYVDAARDAGWQGSLPVDLVSHAAAAYYLDWSKVTIFGGTTEVQKNIVAKSVLGL